MQTDVTPWQSEPPATAGGSDRYRPAPEGREHQGEIYLKLGGKVRRAAALLALACLFQNFALAGQPARVWAVNDGEKVERDDLANRNRASNSAWDGRRIKIFGARNEVVAFQVVVESGAEGIGELRVALPELK